MKQISSTKSLVHKARELRDHLKWARSQFYIGIVGYLFFGWCWMKGMTVDKAGQRLDAFVVLWTAYLIFRAISTAYKHRKYKGLLHRLVFNEGLKLKIK